MNRTLKILSSNWINILLIIASVYVYAFIIAYSDKAFTFSESIFSATYLTFLYGLMFWVGFIVCILILDIILFSFSRSPKYTAAKLLAEWIIIIVPFVYWMIKYNEWIFLVGILAFLLG